jgi:hypothetical protein
VLPSWGTVHYSTTSVNVIEISSGWKLERGRDSVGMTKGRN